VHARPGHNRSSFISQERWPIVVHEKKKSGDPDYDDKVPADRHVGKVVTAGDGREVRITEANGPQNLDGTHANLDDPKGDAGDNRPAPGEVAEEESSVQTYDTEATPAKNLGTVNSQQELDNLTTKGEDKPAAGQSGDQVNEDNQAAAVTGRTRRK
jgi:hypothetical protein